MSNRFYRKKMSSDELSYVSKDIVDMIGIELRRRRLLAERTLSDYSCGCSLSYLSKIEGGKIIPKYQVLRDYCLDNNIKQSELDSMINIDKTIKEAINCLASGNKEKILEIASESFPFNNYKASLVKMSNALASEDYRSLENEVLQVKLIEKDLKTLDRNIFIYFSMVLANYHNRYFDTLRYHKNFVKLENEYALNALTYKELLIASLESGLVDPFEFNNKVQQDTVMFNNIFDYNVKETFLKAIIKQGTTFNEELVENFSYFNQAYYYNLHNNTIKLEELLIKDVDIHTKLICLYGLGKDEEVKMVYEKFENEINDKEFIHLSLNIDRKTHSDYKLYPILISKYLPYVFQIQDVYYISDFIQILSSVSEKIGKQRDFLREYIKIKKYLDVTLGNKLINLL